MPSRGDHKRILIATGYAFRNPDITICLHSMPQEARTLRIGSGFGISSESITPSGSPTRSQATIDTQGTPLLPPTGQLIIRDFLFVHLIRSSEGNTIISYHPTLQSPTTTTTAKYLHQRIRAAGQNVYWQSVIRKSPDPAVVLLIFFRHAIIPGMRHRRPWGPIIGWKTIFLN
ncbi:hypothetical protein P691DRAFT_544412 [Macrolepiota fuliginosa MF-IS2]|uniref:Uncharacterized protein n=1 Tax=Macrolepiota fuliginosa MF-IS2 TaxID=1400762 RepID=A0A9P5WZ69_9AGAR|nr:hypothetical protein P691DRAFT_544412 [Macrolepiota fuliginosa MF-IS2]